LICWLTADWVICKACAASVKLKALAEASKARNQFKGGSLDIKAISYSLVKLILQLKFLRLPLVRASFRIGTIIKTAT
jgi:hypothetical protein